MVIVPSVPAFGAGFSVRVTVASSVMPAQSPAPETVYVYTPASDSDQVPPSSAFVKASNNSASVG